MKIYTRRGDQGETDLFGGPRVAKDDARVEAYGTVDELNAALGVARAALGGDAALPAQVARIQDELFHLGAELATPDSGRLKSARIGAAEVDALESEIDQMEAENAPLHQFILPAGPPGAAALHLARTVCRRAERLLVGLARSQPLRPELVRYLNRLSDWLFVAARAANRRAGVPDVLWTPRRP